MLYIHTSKIASLTGFNKYIKYDKYIEIFIDYLYKYQDELKSMDEKNKVITFTSDSEYIDNLLYDINENDQNKIKNILNSDIISNENLLESSKKLEEITNNSNISIDQKKQIKEEINNRINCNYGSNTENIAIKLYEEETKQKVYNNNDELFVMEYNNYKICGKVDGFIDINNKTYLLEVKNRKNRIFNIIPLYEQIQLISYTKLCNNTNIIFLQCINDKIDIKTLDNYAHDYLWDDVINKLNIYVNFVYMLRNNDILRYNFLENTIKNKYKFLKKYLYWL